MTKIMKLLEFHLRTKKIIEILEFQMRIIKIMKIQELEARNMEIMEIIKIFEFHWKNKENYENHKISIRHENPRT